MAPYKYKDGDQLPVYSWIPAPEYYSDGDMVTQIKHLARLPFAFHHVAVMPDGHVGYGMPIGGVLATKNVIIPNAVGVDIGCGMCAVRTNMYASYFEKHPGVLKAIMDRIRRAVPVGFKHNDVPYTGSLLPKFYDKILLEVYQDGTPAFEAVPGINPVDTPVIWSQKEKGLYQIGTLGGGNHFIEIQKDEIGRIWIMIHSGSRNLGKQVADYYNREAKQLNAKYYSGVPKEWDLAFLPRDTELGKAYAREMNMCVDFAYANRALMLERVYYAFSAEMDGVWFCPPFREDDGDLANMRDFNHVINIAHNYASVENHYGENVVIHRKGATLARMGTIGIIPGSQGTGSYIVRGKGNKESFTSCSHGAGRRMGRNEARRSLDLEKERKKLDDQGILHAIRTEDDLDEAPGAYKDIDTVMANQEDLVDVLVRLKPLCVVKG
jgi:tRNA-splicing ligase RtcB